MTTVAQLIAEAEKLEQRAETLRQRAAARRARADELRVAVCEAFGETDAAFLARRGGNW
jgi:chaperonin cofactor prefoldin